MQKIEATSLQAQSADLVGDNIAQLKKLFPELLTENAHGARQTAAERPHRIRAVAGRTQTPHRRRAHLA